MRFREDRRDRGGYFDAPGPSGLPRRPRVSRRGFVHSYSQPPAPQPLRGFIDGPRRSKRGRTAYRLQKTRSYEPRNIQQNQSERCDAQMPATTSKTVCLSKKEQSRGSNGISTPPNGDRTKQSCSRQTAAALIEAVCILCLNFLSINFFLGIGNDWSGFKSNYGNSKRLSSNCGIVSFIFVLDVLVILA